MNSYLSKKLTFFSFWLMVGVVYIHSVILKTDSLSGLIQNFISHQLLQFCVPLFFIISGYLFFISENDKSVDYVKKWRKRTKTLLLPYIIWSLGIFLIVYIMQSLPLVGNFFPQKFRDMTAYEKLMNALIYPYNYPLWFLRELILYILVTPIVYFLLRKLDMLVLIAVFISGLFLESYIKYHIKIFQVYPFFYFVLGCYLGIKKNTLSFNPKSLYIAGLLYIAVNLLVFFTELGSIQIFAVESYEFIFLKNVKNLLGCLFFWNLYDRFSGADQRINRLYKYSFFIFAMHGIPATILTKAVAKIINNNVVVTTLYFLNPVIIIGLCIITAFLIHKYLPRFYNLVTGGRLK